METFSALLALCEGNPPDQVDFLHKGRWRGAFIFSLTCASTKGWTNNRDAGDLRRHGAHDDVSAMCSSSGGYISIWSYYQHHIGNINLAIVVIFSVAVCLMWLYFFFFWFRFVLFCCVCFVLLCFCCRLLPIDPEKSGFLFSLLPHTLRCVQMIGYIMVRMSYLLVCTLDHLNIIILLDCIENAFPVYSVRRVPKIKYILSIISCTISGTVYRQPAHFSFIYF